MTTCPLCHGKGLLPFKNRADTWVDCECKLEHPEPERYLPTRPEDFDFACSSSFRAASYQHCSQPDPGYIPPEPEAPPPQVQVITRYKYVAPATDEKPSYKDISA